MPLRRLPLLIGLCSVALIGSSQNATTAAERTAGIPKLKCIACHAGPNRVTFDRKTGQSRSVTISMQDFHNASHGKVECLDCHAKGFNAFPHRNKKTETCMDCHPRTDRGAEADKPYEFERMQREFEATVHFTEYQHAKERCCGTATGKAASANTSSLPDASKASGQKAQQRFTCEHCHEPHYFKATKAIEHPKLIRENDNGPCLSCHKDDASGPLSDPAKPNLLLAHRYLPYTQRHLDGTRCIDCHTNVKATVAHDLPRGKKADQGCNTCHSIDNVLMTRLYRYVNDSDTTFGFRNAALLQDGYVMGGNRHKWTDIAAYLLMGFGLVLVLAHSGWRIIGQRQSSAAEPDGAGAEQK
jgi:hypothetical protein